MDTVLSRRIESDPAIGHATHHGLVRDHNEDSYRIEPDLKLWVLADGMGGHENGEVASAIAVAHVAQKIAEGMSLTDAVTSTHDAVLAAPARGQGKPGMGTTAVALQLADNHYRIAWVGDSRAYLWDGNNLTQLTRDHSYVQKLLDGGAITKEEAELHLERNILTQAIGSLDIPGIAVDEVSGWFCRGEQILLCSDGLSGIVPEEKIEEVLAAAKTAQEAADKLIQATLERGAEDNVTVLLIPAPAGAPERRELAVTKPMRSIGSLIKSAWLTNNRLKIISAVIGACLAVGLFFLASDFRKELRLPTSTTVNKTQIIMEEKQ